MKGLLIKDAYMTIKYCKSILLFFIAFSAAQFFIDNMTLFVYIPVITGMVPVTLLGYDERSKWSEYLGVLPYSKAQIVSSKYIIGLIIQISVFIVFFISMVLKMTVSGSISISELLSDAQVFLIMSMFSTSFTLPFIFKFGIEKGRMAYYIIIIIICSVSTFASLATTKSNIMNNSELYSILPFAFIGVTVLYILSWILSIKLYKSKQ